MNYDYRGDKQPLLLPQQVRIYQLFYEDIHILYLKPQCCDYSYHVSSGFSHVVT
jgi:hypothetical protein